MNEKVGKVRLGTYIDKDDFKERSLFCAGDREVGNLFMVNGELRRIDVNGDFIPDRFKGVIQDVGSGIARRLEREGHYVRRTRLERYAPTDKMSWNLIRDKLFRKIDQHVHRVKREERWV